jgi:biopolymer transport protein ExbB
MNMKESVMEVIDVFKSGGPVMYALLLCSICTAVIMIERGMFYHRAGKNLGIFVDNLPDMLLNKSWNDAYADAAQEDNAAAFVAQEGIRAAAEGKDLRLALDTAYSTAAAELRAHLNYLSMIVTLSPLLGLLGTIAGMISSFQIFNLQAGQPMAITGGIGEALIATATGLCVAIFALVVHTVFAQKMDDILTVIEKADAIISSEGRRRGI